MSAGSPDVSSLPDPASAARALELARENGIANPAQLEALARVAGISRWLGRFLARTPGALARVVAGPRDRTRNAEDHLALAREIRRDAPSLANALRVYRHGETSRALLRDLAGAAVRETAQEVADIAAACFQVAIDELVAIETRPRDEQGAAIPFSVVGMGKLGGRELNYSSDVDVIYAYGTDRGSAPDGATPHEWFARAASRVTRALAEVTEDGHAFRVDLDLRPEGKRGPPVNSLRSIEIYYESYGATWERAAWLRARPVAGDAGFGATVLSSVEPFVYRRWLDYATIDAIREMKDRIDREGRARERERGFDVKLAPGGIRELEFFVQTLQLVNAGKRVELRTTHTLDALGRLAAAGLVKETERRRLAEAWEFLRNLEHRLQARELAQTHVLPDDEEERGIIAVSLGLGRDPAALEKRLATHRHAVSSAFDGLFREKARKAKAAAGPEVALLADPTLDETHGRALAASLRRQPDAPLFADPGAAADAFARIRGGPARSRRKDEAFRYLARIAPTLFEELRASPDPDAAVHNLEGFLAKIGGRTTLLALLAEHAPTVTLLVRLFGASDHLAASFLFRPELLDVLVGSGHTRPHRHRPELRREAAAMAAAGSDIEAKLDAVRRFRSAETLRIGMADLWGGLELDSVQRQLSDVADAVAEQALSIAAAEAGVADARRFVVLAFGRLGGREMAYSSDLDLVFVHDAPEWNESLLKLAQRFVAALSAPTREGIAYRVDTRLRPSGSSGMLVVSAASLVEYLRTSARTWERQAWLRARPIAGDRGVWRRARPAVQRILLRPDPPPAELAAEIAAMRERMEKEIAGQHAGRVNLKTGRGGLVDAEFAAQLLQLLHGREHPFLLTGSTAAALRRAAAAGFLDAKTHDALARGWRFLTHLENRMRVVTGRPEDELPDEPAAWDALARRSRLSGGEGSRLRAETLVMRDAMRAAFLSVARA